MSTARREYPVLLSIVVVVDGWAAKAFEVVRRIASEVAPLVADYEIILVDNSGDAAWREAYLGLTAIDGEPNVQVFRLLRRTDYETAAWAAVENSLGDYVLVVRPLIESLLPLPDALDAAVGGGADLVLIVNETPHSQTASAALLQRIYLLLFRSLGGLDLSVEAAQYRLMSKRVVSYLLQQPRPASQYRALPAVAGFSKRMLRYRAPRPVNRRGSVRRDARRAFRFLVANSTAPPRLASMLSLTSAALNVLYSSYVVAVGLYKPDVEKGWVTLSLQQSGMFFIFSLMAFVLTEYMIENIRSGRDGTPYFIIEEMTSAQLTRHKRLKVEGNDHISPPAAEPVRRERRG